MYTLNQCMHLHRYLCIFITTQIKQNAIYALTQVYINGTLTPKYLYQYITNKEMDISQWQISCFALLQVMYDNVHAFENKELLQFSQCLGKIIRQFYQSPNTYIRAKPTNVPHNKHLSWELKPFIKNSLKRTFGQLIKYLLSTKIPIEQYFTISHVLPKSNNKVSTINEQLKTQMYFSIQISLAVIQAVTQFDERMGFMKQRTVNYKFQTTIITDLLTLLPHLVSRMDAQIQLFSLVDSLENNLAIENLPPSSNPSKLSQIQLPLRLIQYILYFPYNFKIEHQQLNNQLFSNQKQPQSIQYPPDVSMLIGSKQFVQSIFGIANKFITYIHKQISIPTINNNNNFNLHLYEYLKYYKITMKYISQVCKIKTSQFFININEQIMTLQDNQYDQYYSQILVNTVVILIIQMYHQHLQPMANQIAVNADILLSIAESFTTVLFSLINNVQFPTLLQQPRQFLSSPLNLQQIYKQLISILFKLTQYNIKYHPNLTLSLYYSISHQQNNNAIQCGSKYGLRMLFLIWQHMLIQRNNILVRLIQVTDKQSSYNSLLIKNSQNNNHAQHLIDTVTDILIMFANKLLSQSSSILLQQIGTKITTIQKSSQLNYQLSQFFKLITTIIKTQSHSSITLILTCVNNHIIRLRQLWNNEFKVIMNCLQSCKNINNGQTNPEQIYTNLPSIQSQIGNGMLIYKYLMMGLHDIKLINPIDNNSNNNSATTIGGKSHNPIDSLAKSTEYELKLFSVLYTHSYIPSHKQPSIEHSLILYTSEHILYIIQAMRQKQYQFKRQLRNIMEIIMQENKNYTNDINANDTTEIQQWLAKNTKTNRTHIQNILIDHSIFVQLLQKNSLTINKTLTAINNTTNSTVLTTSKTNLKIYTDLIMQLLNQYNKIGKAYITAHHQFLLMFKSIEKQLTIILNNKTPKYAEFKNLFLTNDQRTNLHIVQQNLKTICFLTIDNIQKSYSVLTFNTNTSIDEQSIQLITNINKQAIQVLSFILLHHEPFEKVDHLQLSQKFQFLFKVLRLSQIKQLKQNKIINSDTLSAPSILQLSISALTGILSSFLQSKSSQNTIPFSFLTSLHKNIPLTQLMQIYITIDYTTPNQQQKIRKINKLLQLHLVILQNLRIVASSSKASLQFQYRFISGCLIFWTNSLQYAINDTLLQHSISILINISQILKKMLIKNLIYPYNNINFYLLHQQSTCHLQHFIIKILSIYQTIMQCDTNNSIQLNNKQNINILTYYKQLNPVVNSTLVNICINLLQFIFQYNTHNIQNNNQQNQYIKLLQPFTNIFIQKIKLFIHQSKQIIKTNHLTQYHMIKLEKYFNIPLEKITNIQQQLNIFKITLAYVNRAKLYQHNKGLQANITYFLTKIHKNFTNIKQNQIKNTTDQQLQYLQFSFFTQLIKLALVIASRFKNNTSSLNHICSILTNLPGIFYHYNTINQSSNQAWGLSAKLTLQKIIGINHSIIDNFFIIWNQCCNEQIHYEHQKYLFIQWFDQFNLLENNCSQTESQMNSTNNHKILLNYEV